MHIQRPHRIPRRHNFPHRIIFPDIPQSDFSIATSTHQFAEATALHVDACDPLLVATPVLDHRHGWSFAGVEDADGAIAVTGAEDVAGDLIGGQGCNAGTGAGGDVLWMMVFSMAWLGW